MDINTIVEEGMYLRIIDKRLSDLVYGATVIATRTADAGIRDVRVSFLKGTPAHDIWDLSYPFDKQQLEIVEPQPIQTPDWEV